MINPTIPKFFMLPGRLPLVLYQSPYASYRGLLALFNMNSSALSPIAVTYVHSKMLMTTLWGQFVKCEI